MTTTTFAPLDADAHVRRDGIGRYKMMMHGRLVGVTRATTIAGTLDDKQGLIPWHARMTVAGLARSIELRNRLDNVDINDKSALASLEAEAFEIGGGNRKRDLGSHLHHVAEMFWTHGQRPTDPTEAAWLDRVIRALDAAGLTPIPGMCERVVLDDVRKIAGTVDLFVQTIGGGIYVADIKTGSVQQIGVAVQLAIYANAPYLYTFGAAEDGSDDRTEPNRANRATGYVIHAPSDSDVCSIEEVDLLIGDDLLDLALTVREMRKAKPCMTVLTVDDTPPADLVPVVLAPIGDDPVLVDVLATQIDAERKAWLRGRADTIRTHEQATSMVVRMWPAGLRPLTDDEPHTAAELDAIDELFTQAEAVMGAAFPDRDPAKVAAASTVAADDPRVIEAQAHYDGLPLDLRAELVDQVQAVRRVPPLTSGRATEDDYALMRVHMDQIMALHAQRIQNVAGTLSITAALDEVLVELASGGRTTRGEDLTAVDVQHLDNITDAINLGWLTVADDGSVAVDIDAAVTFAGTKRDLLTLVRAAAKAHGLERPASTSDAAANPRLIAAAAVA
jgi:hypothetical protein